ncbi:enoyl-CoA hydratase/isomerase family protein [Aestuariibius sp. HNIBRBA575]|uniref:enoyl-CoA hydratase/isomerase family protein n=1 Tax=Aestuariibius sp. HNIBRBA575 TaxID=3233343 RepID=UPI0034A25AFA
MAKLVKFRIRGGIAIVTLANPPVNALEPDVLSGLFEVFKKIETHPDVKAVTLIAEGKLFSAGDDIRTMGRSQGKSSENQPSLSDVCNLIEACPHPVVAGLHGPTLGSGMSLALAAHHRVASPLATLGLPEVTLGIVPEGGATQRLARLCGAEAALDLMLGGQHVTGQQAQTLGLIDSMVQGHLHTGAFAYAMGLMDNGAAPRPVRNIRTHLSQGEVFLKTTLRRRKALETSPLLAPAKIIDCVEAALLLPFDAGLSFEKAAADECMNGPQSTALRHVFLAEREIGAELMKAEGPNRRIVDPDGRGVVSRLQHVFGAVANYLVDHGYSERDIDGALVDYGFERPLFGAVDARIGPNGHEIQRRIISALMVEGAKLIEDRKAAKGADIDALSIHGLGFPRWRGGPMMAAQIMGLTRLQRDMADWSKDAPFWAVPELVTDATKYADGFDALGRRALMLS